MLLPTAMRVQDDFSPLGKKVEKPVIPKPDPVKAFETTKADIHTDKGGVRHWVPEQECKQTKAGAIKINGDTLFVNAVEAGDPSRLTVAKLLAAKRALDGNRVMTASEVQRYVDDYMLKLFPINGATQTPDSAKPANGSSAVVSPHPTLLTGQFFCLPAGNRVTWVQEDQSWS